MLNKKIEKSPADDWLFWFNKSLSLEEQKKIKKVLKELRYSQNLLWEALNIYDDFFDQEGKISDLPRANNYFRRYLTIHSQLKLPRTYFKLQKKLFNQLDKKNYQEIVQERLKIKNSEIIFFPETFHGKNIISLSDKSLVLSLSVVAIFLLLDPNLRSPKIKHLINFFKYFLSAKQLSDDSLDWLSDLRNGFLSEANLPIILVAQKRGIKLNLKNDITTLNLLFIKEAAPIICKKLKLLCSNAKQEIKIVKNINHSLILCRFIEPIESACQKAENFRALVLEN